MMMCHYCAFLEYKEQEYAESTKAWCICSDCKEFKKCGVIKNEKI